MSKDSEVLGGEAMEASEHSVTFHDNPMGNPEKVPNSPTQNPPPSPPSSELHDITNVTSFQSPPGEAAPPTQPAAAAATSPTPAPIYSPLFTFTNPLNPGAGVAPGGGPLTEQPTFIEVPPQKDGPQFLFNNPIAIFNNTNSNPVATLAGQNNAPSRRGLNLNPLAQTAKRGASFHYDNSRR